MTLFGGSTLNKNIALTLSAGLAIAPIVTFADLAVAQRASFTDVDANYWAKPFIERLAQEDIIAGFPDGSFKPNQPVTRAQFAAIVRKAFKGEVVRNATTFKDIPAKYWATPSIDKAYTTGFMSGYPDQTFRPEQQIPKVQALVSLSNGLRFDPVGAIDKPLELYRDAEDIPDYARKSIAAATQKNLVVNYPNVAFLNPNEPATRADIAAYVYQALVQKKEFTALPSRSDAAAYIVTYKPAGTPKPPVGTPKPPAAGVTIARNTVLPVQYPGGNDVKLIIAPGETLRTNFELASNVVDAQGKVLIPQGSLVQGEFQPLTIDGSPTKGTQYYADKVTIGGKVYPMVATSNPIVATSPQNLSPGTLQGGLASAAAQLLLGRLLGTGGFNLGNLLGTLSGGNNNPNTANANGVIVVEPKKLSLRVQNDFKVAAQPQPNTLAQFSPLP